MAEETGGDEFDCCPNWRAKIAIVAAAVAKLARSRFWTGGSGSRSRSQPWPGARSRAVLAPVLALVPLLARVPDLVRGSAPSAKFCGVKFKMVWASFVVWKFPSEQTVKTVSGSVIRVVLPDIVVASKAPSTSLMRT